jgi:hypothetical protein
LPVVAFVFVFVCSKQDKKQNQAKQRQERQQKQEQERDWWQLLVTVTSYLHRPEPENSMLFDFGIFPARGWCVAL